MATDTFTVLCPGQGAQAVGMGRAWAEASSAARAIFERADDVLRDEIGADLSARCFNGPPDALNRTDVSQPAIYACSVACAAGLRERGDFTPAAAAGLSLGEYTALHLADVFSFEDGLRLVARRGRLMQEAAERSAGSMVALIGADEDQAEAVCGEAVRRTGGSTVLVCANFNAPGQIVLSGSVEACDEAAAVAGEKGFRASRLTVAGAFHSPLMRPAADRMAEALAATPFSAPTIPVWSNVTAAPHPADQLELMRQRLVEQIVKPVRWAQSCAGLVASGHLRYHELAPGTVLKGLLRRIDRTCEVLNHDRPDQP